jgi:hypothetical protein
MALVSDKGKRQKNNIDSFPDKVLKVAYNLLFAVQMNTKSTQIFIKDKSISRKTERFFFFRAYPGGSLVQPRMFPS